VNYKASCIIQLIYLLNPKVSKKRQHSAHLYTKSKNLFMTVLQWRRQVKKSCGQIADTPEICHLICHCAAAYAALPRWQKLTTVPISRISKISSS
jgi:hypothetical protein